MDLDAGGVTPPATSSTGQSRTRKMKSAWRPSNPLDVRRLDYDYADWANDAASEAARYVGGRRLGPANGGLMQIDRKFVRLVLVATGFAAGLVFSNAAMAQAAINFHFHFDGSMSCMQPVPVSNAPVSGDGAGTLNPDGSVNAEITQGLLVFKTVVRFDSRVGPGLTSVPGGTGQVRVTGRSSLRFIWNLPNNALVVTIAVRGQSCSASFQADLFPGKTQYTFFDGSMYHYCGRPVMTSSSCELR